MALNPHFRETERNNFLDDIDSSLNPGALLRIYDGTQPADVATAITSQVLLAQLAMNSNPAFGAASGGVLTANAISDDTSADNTGTATWGTLTTSGGTRIVDFSVGTSGADLNFNTVSFSAGATVSVSALTITFPA